MKVSYPAHKNFARSWRPLGAAAILLGASFGLSADDLPLSETRLADLGAEEFFRIGEQVTGQVCALCHGWDTILARRMTPSEWNFVVSDMVARGASATGEQQEFITRFMSWAWGRVAVNSAPVADLVAVIGISRSQAEAIVSYREANGPFADLASLKQVPGLDAGTLDAQADALQFN